MTLKEEIKLLERKVELMREYAQLMDKVDRLNKTYQPYIPYTTYPQPYVPYQPFTYPWVTYSTGSATITDAKCGTTDTTYYNPNIPTTLTFSTKENV
jgi:hypothetical protein